MSVGPLTAMTFYIYDPHCNKTAMYELRGFTFAGISTPASLTLPSDEWTDVTALLDMTVSDFGGLVKLIDVGAEDKSWARLGFEPLGFPPFEAGISTGFEWGADIGLTGGVLTLQASLAGNPFNAPS
jgi:hypothetical protein